MCRMKFGVVRHLRTEEVLLIEAWAEIYHNYIITQLVSMISVCVTTLGPKIMFDVVHLLYRSLLASSSYKSALLGLLHIDLSNDVGCRVYFLFPHLKQERIFMLTPQQTPHFQASGLLT
jgi:hypothetical protein